MPKSTTNGNQSGCLDTFNSISNNNTDTVIVTCTDYEGADIGTMKVNSPSVGSINIDDNSYTSNSDTDDLDSNNSCFENNLKLTAKKKKGPSVYSFDSLVSYENEMNNNKIELRNANKLIKHRNLEKKYNLYSFIKYIQHTFMDLLGCFLIYFKHVVTLEGILIMLNAIGATCFYLFHTDENGKLLSTRLDFSLLGFAVIFPLTFLMNQAFSRRESSLTQLNDFRELLKGITIACLTWGFPYINDKNKSGRNALPENYNRDLKQITDNIIELVYRFLALPLVGRERHFLFPSSKNEQQDVERARNEIEHRIAKCFYKIDEHVEILKDHGLTSSESSRVYQYVWLLKQRFGYLRNIKVYRTPYANRSFLTIYMLILPWIFGPYYVYVAQSGPQMLSNLNYAYALMSTAFTFLILLGLMNASRFLEDPFVNEGFDNVNLKHEFALLAQNIDYQFGKAEKKRLRQTNGINNNNNNDSGVNSIDSIGMKCDHLLVGESFSNCEI